jgi:hypothetical protein
VAFVFITARRFGLPAIPVLVLFTIGFVISVVVSNLVFSLLVGGSGAILSDNRSILGGAFSWAAIALAILLVLRKPTEATNDQQTTTDGSKTPRRGATSVIWTLLGYGLASVVAASICATIADLLVFFLYGSVGGVLPVPDFLIWIAATVYVFVCTIASYFSFGFLLQRKAKIFKQILYAEITNSPARIGQEMIPQRNTSSRNLWISGCLGSIMFICLIFGVVGGYILYESTRPYPLDGTVSVPTTVKLGDEFDFIITLTNPTTEPVFIKHIVLSDSLGAPTIWNGASIVRIEPDMVVEAIYTNSFQYSYFREIQPGETQTVIFHMRAENTGVYYEDVGVYARDPLHSEPAFINAFQFTAAQVEIKP